MVARIAPSPIGPAVAIGDADAHAVSVAPSPSHDQAAFQPPAPGATASHAPSIPPPTMPGEAFAAAVIAGQLPPRPVSPQDLARRLGAAWQPPASALRLMDRSA